MTKNKTYYFVREHGVYMYRCRSERVLDVEAWDSGANCCRCGANWRATLESHSQRAVPRHTVPYWETTILLGVTGQTDGGVPFHTKKLLYFSWQTDRRTDTQRAAVWHVVPYWETGIHLVTYLTGLPLFWKTWKCHGILHFSGKCKGRNCQGKLLYLKNKTYSPLLVDRILYEKRTGHRVISVLNVFVQWALTIMWVWHV